MLNKKIHAWVSKKVIISSVVIFYNETKSWYYVRGYSEPEDRYYFHNGANWLDSDILEHHYNTLKSALCVCDSFEVQEISLDVSVYRHLLTQQGEINAE